MKDRIYKNWHLEKQENKSIWLYLDKTSSTANTLSSTVLEELSKLLDVCEKENPKMIVFASAKSNGFIYGADIKEFADFKTIDEVKQSINRGQSLFERIQNLKIPTLACIEGICLGGGLELILACRYRIALESENTKFGFPEIMLGIFPGLGGSVRAPRLIGAVEAMKLILTGKTISAKKAKVLGLVDEVVPKRQLKNAVDFYAAHLPKPHQPSYLQSLTNAKLVRPLLAKLFKKQVRQKINPEHYPAPYAVIENWEKYGIADEAFAGEAESMAKVAVEGPARNMIYLFLLRDQLKSEAKDSNFKAKHVHIIGAGTMGADIAAWCALKGYKVTLQDVDPGPIAKAYGKAYQFYKKKLKDDRNIEAALDRLIPDLNGEGIKQADIIIEAIVEKLDAKQNLFKLIENQAKANAILATNTSSIPLDEINKVLNKPERLVGMHFFNPVTKMELVEIIKGKITDERIITDSLKFIYDLGKLPLPVASSPGFLINRALTPYLLESVVLLNEDIPPSVIDKAAEDFGMPMGPLELVDQVGLDVCLSVAENLSKHYPDIKIPDKLKELVKKGELGKKTGKGIYVYKKGKPIKPEVKEYKPKSDITERLILRMLNECVACLREKVVEKPEFIDAGMVFGTGFAPFRGGPMHYIEHEGTEILKQKLQVLQKSYGERFKPDKGWEGGIKNESKHSQIAEQTAYAQGHNTTK